MNITLMNYLNIDVEYNHVEYFRKWDDVALQSYFHSNFKQKVIYNCSYQRKDVYIRLPISYDEAIKYNYCFYKNEDESITYYCFIKDVKFVADDRCDIYIETDVFTTWRNCYEIKSSFIEREHVDDDTFGANTTPENVQLGEYIVYDSYQEEKLKMDRDHIVLGSTIHINSSGNAVKNGGSLYGGIYSGCEYYKYGWRDEYDNSGDIPVQTNKSVASAINEIVDAGGEDGIVSLFMGPSFLMNINNVDNFGPIESSSYPLSFNIEIQDHLKLDDYTPKNNKLLTFPYRYLLVSNGNGGSAEYYYELFNFKGEETESKYFIVYGVLTPGCSIRLVPAIYKGMQTPENEGLNGGKYPICNWNSDQYTNWLTQNSVNIATSVVGAVGGVVGGAVGGFMVGNVPGAIIGAIGGLVSGGSQVANTMNEVYKASRVPPQSHGNTNCGDVVASHGDNTFTFYHMTIKKEYAKRIDDYFTAYGYQVNRFGIPLEDHRNGFWYTKTIDVNISPKNNTPLPLNDLKKIKDAYNKGITFWANEYRDYSQNNDIK